MSFVHHYWLVPVLSGVIWWVMLALLLSLWALEGFPNYAFERKPRQQVQYISDIGAGKYQFIFVIGSSVQGVLFVLSQIYEIRLRNTGRLRRHFHIWPMACLWMSLGFAVVGQVGIVLVSIYDTRKYPDAHVSCLVIYIVFVGVSALLNVFAAAALERSYLDQLHVKISLWYKIAWFIVEMALAIAFVDTQRNHIDTPAILEWIVSFLYPFYQLVLAWDLWPAIGKTKNHYPKYNPSYPGLDNSSSLTCEKCAETISVFSDRLLSPDLPHR